MTKGVSMSKLVKLSSGQMPVLGLGTWRSDPGNVKAAVKTALSAGYRHIDAAWIYGNEAEVGEGLVEGLKENGLKREDIWVTSKLWNTKHRPEHVEGAVRETLKDLQCGYLDLYLMHWPVAFVAGEAKTPKDKDGKVALDRQLSSDQSTTWAAMEKLVDQGLVRNIGVSNFCVERLEKLLPQVRIKPAVNQVEMHPYLQQPKLMSYCAEKGIHLTAYSPLGSQDSHLLQEPVLLSIAERHNVDPAAVLIAWAYGRPNTSVLPKSVTPARIESNFRAKDIALSEEDKKQLDRLDKHHRFVNPSGAWGLDIYCEQGGQASL